MRACPHQALALAAAIVLMLSAAAAPAHAGWGPEPVQVHPTSAGIPQVAAVGDGENGAIVVWQEQVAGGAGSLRAAHVLRTGDLDPDWASPVSVCTTKVARADLKLLTDGRGGAHVFWMEGAAVYYTWLRASGMRGAGLPDRGRRLVNMWWSALRPRLMSDGVGGFYIAWLGLDPAAFMPSGSVSTFRLLRFGSGGLPSPGWPYEGFAIGKNTEADEIVADCAIAPAPDGRIWAAWCGTSWLPGPEAAVNVERGSRLLLFESFAAPADVWPERGIRVGGFPVDSLASTPVNEWWMLPQRAIVSVSSDGADGAFMMRLSGESLFPGDLRLYPRLDHVDAEGNRLPGWPAEGLPIEPYAAHPISDGPSSFGYRALGDGSGGCYLAFPEVHTDAPYNLAFVHVSAEREVQGALGWVDPAGLETPQAHDGSVWVSSFYPGPAGYWSYNPYVACERLGGPHYSQSYWQSPLVWFGDVGAAALEDGGAIFFWSENQGERHGLYAVRLAREGLVTGVPPAAVASAARFALRFVPGAGLRANAAFAGAGEARLLVADVAGRAVARQAFEAAEGAREWTVPGTAGLAPGLYFARLERGPEARTARVVVTR